MFIDARVHDEIDPRGKRKADMNIEGISMLVTQRSEFATVMQKHGVEGLIERLRARLEVPGAVGLSGSRGASERAGLETRMHGRALHRFIVNIGTALCLVAAVMVTAAPAARAGAFEDGYAAYQRGDFATALETWTPLAESGHARAQYNLGVMYDEGRGVPSDKQMATAWWQRAADQNLPEAL
ncbi:MAG: ABC transporter substrate-binding protein, partial [Phycisphaerales bacterium]